MKYRLLFILLSSLLYGSVQAQHLKPGFNKQEYIEMLKIFSRHGDSLFFKDIAAPEHFRFVYRSPVVGLDNCWDLWVNNDSVAVISIRGTTAKTVSWLENFYAAMVPAKGQLVLSKSKRFTYKLASNPKAAVHVGWLVGMAYLAEDIVPRIDSCYKKGIKEFIVMGHSQGGAIAYLLTSHLYKLREQRVIPSDVRFKTYCSAAPKPGNLYYAYEYEALTQYGWAFNVVNAADWVPETPISIQTLDDFNKTNPFVNAPRFIKQQKWTKRVVMRHIYKRLVKPAQKAQRAYQRYLGNMTYGFVKEHLPEYQSPVLYQSNNYVRTGNMIVLYDDDAYYKLFPDSEKNVFIHHMLQPYLYLAEKLPQ